MNRTARLILHWLGLADHPEPWMGPSGDFFISDKDATCAYLQMHFPSKTVEILSKALGKTMIAKIKGRSFMVSQDYVEELVGYRVERRGKDYMNSSLYSSVWECRTLGKIIRDASDRGYWVTSDEPLRGYREYFRRITSDEFASQTTHLPHDPDGFPIVTPPDEVTLRMARSIPRQI